MIVNGTDAELMASLGFFRRKRKAKNSAEICATVSEVILQLSKVRYLFLLATAVDVHRFCAWDACVGITQGSTTGRMRRAV